jgi:hypothetical protein
MRAGTVSSSALSARTLRARDYVFSPQREADRLIDAWLKDNPGFMHKSTPAMKDLREKLIAKIEEAMASNATKE